MINISNSLPNRIVEAYVGEYASGKSENAINRALDLKNMGRQVTLVDLDMVEPFYTLRPIKIMLMEKGLDVVAWETRDTMGLGEAGSTIMPAMKWALRRKGDIILDIGYGIKGTRTLNLVEGADTDPDLKVIVVINISRPMTSNVQDIVEYCRELGWVNGLVNNTHMGDETTVEIIEKGAVVVTEAAKILGVPVVATAVDEKFKEHFINTDCMGNPVRFLYRYMPQSFW